MPRDLAAVRQIVGLCEAPGVRFHVGGDTRGVYWLQVRFTAPCSLSGAPKGWHGRKWRVSRHSTESEIVQTALMAYLAALEHEGRESFRFSGLAVYGPHLSVWKLWDLLSSPDALEKREEP
jgi:hypothetical protein